MPEDPNSLTPPVARPTNEEMAELARLRKGQKKAVRKRRLEQQLKPYQVELLKLQRYLEQHDRRMIVLFEGRDAAGKGGTIRRVTRFMNEKHYRVVALGKPTEEQRTQWYFQRYVAQFPHGGEMVLFDRSWYNRAMVEAVFGFCTDQEYEQFMKGVVGFEKDLNEFYFDPDYFGLTEATARWTHVIRSVGVLLEGASGAQKIASDGRFSMAVRASARFSYSLAPGREVSLSGGYSSAGLQSFNTGDSDYSYTAIILGGSWVF